MSKGCYIRWSAKHTVSSYLSLDMAKIKKWGLLNSQRRGEITWSKSSNQFASIGYQMTNAGMKLNYNNTSSMTGETELICDEILFSKTKCHFGGDRFWFVCPTCEKQVRVLYGGKHFRCRVCHNIVHNSVNESKNDRSARQIRKIQRALAPEIELSVFDGASWLRKPKWMKKNRYERLILEAHKQESIFKQTSILRFGLEAVSDFFD